MSLGHYNNNNNNNNVLPHTPSIPPYVLTNQTSKVCWGGVRAGGPRSKARQSKPAKRMNRKQGRARRATGGTSSSRRCQLIGSLVGHKFGVPHTFSPPKNAGQRRPSRAC